MPSSAGATERTNEVRVINTHTTTPNTADRKKAWAPRSRTGCFTCRYFSSFYFSASQDGFAYNAGVTWFTVANHPSIEGAELNATKQRPSAGAARSANMSAATQMACFRLRPEGRCRSLQPGASSSKSICAEPQPPDWDFIEAIHFYYTVIRPTRPTQGGKIVDPVFKRVDAPFYVSGVVLMQLGFVSKRLGRRLRYGEDQATLGALWRNHAKYLAEVLAITNRSIREGTPDGAVGAIRSIDHLVGISMALESLLWKAHVDGALAYVESIGGAEAMETWSPKTPMMFIAFFRHIIFYNTTTPALQHSLGYSNYTDKQLELFLDETRLTSDKPLPVGQRVAVVHITRLRHQLATSPLSDQASASIVAEIFQRLTEFDMEAWAQRIQGFEPCVNQALAEIGHDAVWLYAILSLLHARQLQQRAAALIDPNAPNPSGSLCYSYPGDLLVVGIIANYAAVAADTFSSELGILSSAQPRLITSLGLRKVPPGTNGGVTLMGLGAGLFGSMLMVTVAFMFLPACSVRTAGTLGGGVAWTLQDRRVFMGFLVLCGFAGTVLDSVLGALLQRSVKDVRSGKIVEGDGGSRALVNTTTTEKKKDEGSAAGKEASSSPAKGLPSRVVESGLDLLDNNDVNFLMAVTISVGAMYLASLHWGVRVEDLIKP
ncbi:hypothetical protein NLG97_g4858 [Lecanicillium saksenae]|uniref:Uncharacterized protein n=1 Tax=Lecanicillium saksenae TaxID=468837 RepID=A0ACC1QXA6_9HYPO|nr:hypothetical protein NLG97_g4858 [Lecanicillium saksenae]